MLEVDFSTTDYFAYLILSLNYLHLQHSKKIAYLIITNYQINIHVILTSILCHSNGRGTISTIRH